MCIVEKKGAVSHSTAESEMVAADLALRTEALPLMTLFDAILKREIRLLFLEDNQATLRIILYWEESVATTCLLDTSNQCSLYFPGGAGTAH